MMTPLNPQRLRRAAIAGLALALPSFALAAQTPAPAPAPPPPSAPATVAATPATNKPAKAMTQEERQKLFQEWRKRHPEEAAKMDRQANRSPEERQAAVKAWQEQQRLRTNTPPPVPAPNAHPAGSTTPERLAQLRTRIVETEAGLRKKKADGTITPAEQKQLEQVQKYLRQMPPIPNPTNAPAAAPQPHPAKP